MAETDRKSTRLNSSHQITSYAVFCLKKKNDVADRADVRIHLELKVEIHALHRRSGADEAGRAGGERAGRGHVLAHLVLFFFNDTATTEIYTLSLHDALPI